MDRKAGQGKEEEESRARQQEEKRPVQEEEKTPACHGRGHHVVEQDPPLIPPPAFAQPSPQPNPPAPLLH
ncbi:hypothetical protein STEG23_011237, partial [Scotinomys teguina]